MNQTKGNVEHRLWSFLPPNPQYSSKAPCGKTSAKLTARIGVRRMFNCTAKQRAGYFAMPNTFVTCVR